MKLQFSFKWDSDKIAPALIRALEREGSKYNIL